jgi:hypothetical protein
MDKTQTAPFDELYACINDVTQDPSGAVIAIYSQQATIDALTSALATARIDALLEASMACDVLKLNYMTYELSQCAQGAIECRKSIAALGGTTNG